MLSKRINDPETEGSTPAEEGLWKWAEATLDGDASLLGPTAGQVKQPCVIWTLTGHPQKLAGIPMELSVWFLEFEVLGPSRAEQHPHPCRHKTRETHPTLKLDKNLLQHKSSFDIHWFQAFHCITTRHRTKRANFQTWQFETMFPQKTTS